VSLSVEDIGTGIAPGQLNSVFEPFVTTKTTGLGLGLALCRSIVHAHEGRLTAENNPGRGVTFHCVLPLAAVPPRGLTLGGSQTSPTL
jgi:signal transduction histidine kinase